VILEVVDVTSGYGDADVLSGVSFGVNKSEAVALLGRNGMGKTTCLLAIMGLNPARRGAIRFKDRDVTRLHPFQIARLGIGYSPEGRRVFATLTVLQNLRIPFVNKRSRGSDWMSALDRVFSLFPRLQERKDQLAGSLSGGEQQMLAIGRAIIGQDELLLLDEPTEGIAPAIVDSIVAAIKALKAQGTTVLLVDQNAISALGIADRAYVMEKGRIVLEGSAETFRRDPAVLDRYLGVQGDD
jgi:branched-chain amino acid transport system ATP-binding protein